MTGAPALSSPVARRLAIAAVCLVSLVLCCGLAWWQWEKFSSANGTFQNLGYVLQWPLFGLFPAFMFYRIRQLRLRAEADTAAAAHQSAPPVEVPAPRPARAEYFDEDDEEEDAELTAYNRYLAGLAERDDRARRD